MLRRVGQYLIRVTKPFVQRVAQAYDLRVERPLHAFGQHPLEVMDPETASHRIPKSTYFNTRSGRIEIGPGTVFGEDVKLLTGKHMHAAEAAAAGLPQHAVPEEGRDIVIGANCYIGTGAILIGPLTLGDEAVVGAGSVVTRDVPARAFVGGAPAKLVRMLDDR
jgi:acetyltransferase-like isoleucine patch superfamily enzyme